jgi:hypothetical protein
VSARKTTPQKNNHKRNIRHDNNKSNDRNISNVPFLSPFAIFAFAANIDKPFGC